jgi:predicted phosphodiesterase
MTVKVVISDTQLPYENRPALKGLIRFIGEYQPDEVIHIGDLMDYPTPSRWSKGSAEEFAQRMLRHNEYAKARLLGPLRDVYDGPIKVHEGNHDLRPRSYLAQYAPALSEYASDFHISSLLSFDDYGIETLPDFNPVAPGWLTTHGHVGKISLSRNAGSTASNGALKFGKSVVMGHTHRMGIVPVTKGYAGMEKDILWGVEVGHLMDQRKAQYLAGATGNWQTGFIILHTYETHTKPELVPINKGRFIADGYAWEL